MSDIGIVHRYPQAAGLTQAVGGHGIAVLHALIQRATYSDGRLVASVSLRDLCIDVPASKDTVSRRIDQLQRMGIVERLLQDNGPFISTTYVLHLEGHGIELVA